MSFDLVSLSQAAESARDSETSILDAHSPDLPMELRNRTAIIAVAEALLAIYWLERARLGPISEPVE